MKKIFLSFVIILVITAPCYASDSKYSNGLSRLEREWFNRDFPNDDDEIRISRLEEKVFGSIHDKDLKSRYLQLRDAFDAKKQMKASHDYDIYRGIPTSVPISVEDLIRGY